MLLRLTFNGRLEERVAAMKAIVRRKKEADKVNATGKGRDAFNEHIAALEEIIHDKKI